MRQFIFLMLLCMSLFFLNGCNRGDNTSDHNNISDSKDGITDSNIQDGVGGENNAQNHPDYYGTFQIKDYRTAYIYGLNDEEIQACMNFTVTYTADRVYINGVGVSIDDGGYEFNSITKDEFQSGFKIDTDWWGNRSSITEVRVSAPIYDAMGTMLGGLFYIVDEDTLCFFFDGVFFLAERVKTADLNIFEEQTFEIEINHWETVQFISCLPYQYNAESANEDASFYLAKDGEIIYRFPDAVAHNIRDSLVCEGIKYVIFADYDKDGDKDIFIGISYRDRESNIEITLVRVYEYFQHEKEFYYYAHLSNVINQSINPKQYNEMVK